MEKTLREIIELLGNKEYPYIEFHVTYEVNGEKNDEFYGDAYYKDGQLFALDNDVYSLDDIFYRYEEFEVKEDTEILDISKGIKHMIPIPKGTICLKLWEKAEV